MRRSLAIASVLLASACGLDVVGTAEPAQSSSPTDVTPHGSATATAPDGGDSDASVGACRDSVLSFDGVDDFVNVPHDAALDLDGDFAVEAWIKPGSKTSEMHVVSHHDTNESSGWLLRIASGRVEIVVYGTETFSDQGYSAGNSGASYVVHAVTTRALRARAGRGGTCSSSPRASRGDRRSPRGADSA